MKHGGRASIVVPLTALYPLLVVMAGAARSQAVDNSTPGGRCVVCASRGGPTFVLASHDSRESSGATTLGCRESPRVTESLGPGSTRKPRREAKPSLVAVTEVRRQITPRRIKASKGRDILAQGASPLSRGGGRGRGEGWRVLNSRLTPLAKLYCSLRS